MMLGLVAERVLAFEEDLAALVIMSSAEGAGGAGGAGAGDTNAGPSVNARPSGSGTGGGCTS
jgi:hypothetical protein